MSDVTDADRRTADGLVAFYRGLRKGGVPDPAETGELAAAIAAALAEERARGIDIGLQNATSIDHYEVGHSCRLCGERWPCDRARTVGLE